MNEEKYMEKIIFITTIACVFLMLLIILFIISESIPAAQEIGIVNFITGSIWEPETNTYGILPMIISTIILVIFFNVITSFHLEKHSDDRGIKII